MGNYIYRGIKKKRRSSNYDNNYIKSKLKSLEYTSHIVCVEDYMAAKEYRAEQDALIEKKILALMPTDMAKDTLRIISELCTEYSTPGSEARKIKKKLCIFDTTSESCNIIDIQLADAHIVLRHKRYVFILDKMYISNLCEKILRHVRGSTIVDYAMRRVL